MKQWNGSMSNDKLIATWILIAVGYFLAGVVVGWLVL